MIPLKTLGAAVASIAATCCVLFFLSPGPLSRYNDSVHEASTKAQLVANDLELLEQNWVDCVDHGNKETREDCLVRWGLSDNGEQTPKGVGKGGSSTSSEIAAKERAARLAHKSAAKYTGPSEVTYKAQVAEKDVKLAAQIAAQSKEKAAKAKAALKAAEAQLAAEDSQSSASKKKIEKWYKEKVKKVNIKLKADKATIKAKKVAAIADAKKKARKAGAAVSDIPSGKVLLAGELSEQ